MAAACATRVTRLQHPRPSRAVAVGPRLFYSSGKTMLILQLASIPRGRSCVCKFDRMQDFSCPTGLSPCTVLRHVAACCGENDRRNVTRGAARHRNVRQHTASDVNEPLVQQSLWLTKSGNSDMFQTRFTLIVRHFVRSRCQPLTPASNANSYRRPPGAIIRRSLRNANAYIVHVTELRRHSGSNSISSICSGFAVRLCVKQFRNKSATNRTSGV